MSLYLTRHADKVQFLLSFLAGNQPTYPLDEPLCIEGPGASGKSYVLNEVRDQTPVPLILVQENRYFVVPATQPSNRVQPVMIIVSLGDQSEEHQAAKYFKANPVYFQPDPDFARSS